jgi:hypothetical protein
MVVGNHLGVGRLMMTPLSSIPALFLAYVLKAHGAPSFSQDALLYRKAESSFEGVL